MIKTLKIKNFRNIKEVEYDLAKTSVFSGMNGLGKSNTLNALVWLLTNTMFSDYEDIKQIGDSIVPIGSVRVFPEVTIELDSGVTFTKRYITEYAKASDTVTGHANKYWVNDSTVNEKYFYETLYERLNFKPSLNLMAKEGSEVNLFIDPLYALGKLDYKVLRTILGKLGASVKPDDIPSYIRVKSMIEGKYLGNLQNAIKDTKVSVMKASLDLETVNNQLELFSLSEEVNPEELKALDEKKAEIQQKMRDMRTNPNATMIEDYRTRVRDNQSKIYELQEELLKGERVGKLDLEKKYKELYEIKEGYLKGLNKCNNDILLFKDEGKSKSAQIKELQETYKLIKAESFNEVIVKCPHCNEDFILNASDKEEWEKHHTFRLEETQNRIQALNDRCNKLVTLIDENKKLADEYQLKIDSVTKTLDEARNNLANYRFNDEKIDNSIKDLQRENREYEFKINELAGFTNIEVENECKKLQIALDDINASIDTYYSKKRDLEQRRALEDKRTTLASDWETKQTLLKNLNAYNQDYVRALNEVATTLTGINFVMAENYIDSKSDGFKEVCYATYEGVPYRELNTSRKILLGIEFINVVKKLTAENDLPLLIDKLEVLDSMSKITNITSSQIICTRVSNENQITLKGE